MILALGAVAAVLLLSGKKSSSCDGRWVKLPSGDIVCETALGDMGYILYKDGKYYHRTQFQPPPGSQYAGTSTNTKNWQNILTTLVGQGVNLFQQFNYQSAGEPEVWAGGGEDAGGAGDPYAGVGIITRAPNGQTRWVCRDKHYSTASGGQGTCSYHGGIRSGHKK